METERKSFIFTWTISNIKHFPGHINSPIFNVHALELSSWYLFLTNKDHEENRTQLFLRRLDGGPRRLYLDYEVSLLAYDGTVLISRMMTNCSFDRHEECRIFSVSAFDRLFKTKLHTYLPLRDFTLRCQLWKSDGEMAEAAQCFGRTTQQSECSSFIWTLDGFSTFESDQTRFIPVRFGSSIGPELMMNLRMTKDANSEEEMNIQLSEVEGNWFEMHLIICKLALLDRTRNVIEGSETEIVFNFDQEEKISKLPSCFSKREFLSDTYTYLPNDALTLKCQIMLLKDLLNIEHLNFGSDAKFPVHRLSGAHHLNAQSKKNNNSITALSEDLRSFYEYRIACDVLLKTEKEIFPAHKLILSARSRAFRAMFEHDMKENAEGMVDIPDVNGDTMRRMLFYLYTDTIEDVFHTDQISQLYEVADKYEILSLRGKCSSVLKAHLCEYNACDILIVADRHHDDDLKKFVQSYVFRHAEEIIDSEEWKNLVKTHSKVAAETMHKKILSDWNKRMPS